MVNFKEKNFNFPFIGVVISKQSIIYSILYLIFHFWVDSRQCLMYDYMMLIPYNYWMIVCVYIIHQQYQVSTDQYYIFEV